MCSYWYFCGFDSIEGVIGYVADHLHVPLTLISGGVSRPQCGKQAWLMAVKDLMNQISASG